MSGRRILLLAVLAYLLAWPLPSVVVRFDLGGHNTMVFNGWEATRAALGPLWPKERWLGGGWLGRLIMVASGLTNLLFVAAAGLAWVRPDRVPRGVTWAVGAATALNTYWLMVFAPGGSGDSLRAGYYLWLSSFALLSVALYHLSRPRDSASTSVPAA